MPFTGFGGQSAPATVYQGAPTGKALADDGQLYDTVQAAVDASTELTQVGPGTFSENVYVDSTGFTLRGSGLGTVIDGGGDDHGVNVQSNDVMVEHLTARTDYNSGDSHHAVNVIADDCMVSRVHVPASDRYGITIRGTQNTILDCLIESTGHLSIKCTSGPRNRIQGNNIIDSGYYGIDCRSDDNIILGNVVLNTSNHSILVGGNDTLVGANRVHNSGDSGITLFDSPVEVSIYNNRVSGSAGDDIYDNGTNTMLDGNVTGAAN